MSQFAAAMAALKGQLKDENPQGGAKEETAPKPSKPPTRNRTSSVTFESDRPKVAPPRRDTFTGENSKEEPPAGSTSTGADTKTKAEAAAVEELPQPQESSAESSADAKSPSPEKPAVAAESADLNEYRATRRRSSGFHFRMEAGARLDVPSAEASEVPSGLERKQESSASVSDTLRQRLVSEGIKARRRVAESTAYPRLSCNCRQGYMGLFLQKEKAEPLFVVEGVDPQGPAWKAGLRIGHFVLAIDGIDASNIESLLSITDKEPGSMIKMKTRDRMSSTIQEVEVALEQR